MLDREACERRVYRLATLLTGDKTAALKVISQVVGAQPDLRHLDSAHIDRLTVLRSRDHLPSVLKETAAPPEIIAALASLTSQQREAWVFARVYRMELRELSKAMDCSVTATKRHLEQADTMIASRLANQSERARATLLAYVMTLDVPPFYRRRILQRRRIKRILIWTAIGVGVVVVAGVLVMLLSSAAQYHE